MWRYFKDRVSMIAYQSLDMLQQQLSDITKQITCDLIKSICGNEFYKSTFYNVVLGSQFRIPTGSRKLRFLGVDAKQIVLSSFYRLRRWFQATLRQTIQSKSFIEIFSTRIRKIKSISNFSILQKIFINNSDSLTCVSRH